MVHDTYPTILYYTQNRSSNVPENTEFHHDYDPLINTYLDWNKNVAKKKILNIAAENDWLLKF